MKKQILVYGSLMLIITLILLYIQTGFKFQSSKKYISELQEELKIQAEQEQQIKACPAQAKKFQTSSNIKPEIQILPSKGTLVVGIDEQVPGEYDSKPFNHEYFEDGEMKTSYVSGYKYIYTFKELGIKIGSDDAANEYFTTIPSDPLFTFKNSTIYQKNTDYFITIYQKDPQEPFGDTLKKYHISQVCDMQKYDLVIGKNTFKNMEVWSLGDKAGSTYHCQQDCEDPANNEFTIFVMNPKKPDRYYKLYLPLGCDDNGCGQFNILELF